jgi:uncharacterized protein (DUF608 family)
MPVGGIGTGTVSLGGRGNLQDWEVGNRPAKGLTPRHSFFALWVQAPGRAPALRALEGPLHPAEYEGPNGALTPNHGLPRFRNCRFRAAYPLAQVLLDDPEVPVSVRLEAFNPLIPAEPDDSGLPIAVLRYVVANPTRETLAVTVCGSLQNFIGLDAANPQIDGSGRLTYDHQYRDNGNEFRAARGVQGIFLSSAGVDPGSEAWGTLALATTASGGISYRTAWADLSWGDTLLDFWDDLREDGKLDEREPGGVNDPVASLAVRAEVPAGESRAITFLLAWHFPNRRTWTPAPEGETAPSDCGCASGSACDCAGERTDPDTIGNYYTTQFADAWDVVRKIAPRLEELEARTVEFVRSFVDADLPEAVKEAALFNLSTLRSQTCFRTRDGRFFGWEGCNNLGGCCHGSCTHVWNYEQATACLFGALARSMREVEFKFSTAENGHMSFRTNLPLSRARKWGVAAADGQMGSLMRLYRDWQLAGDDDMLRALWPAAKRALEFCWIPGGWDADRDGVMEGCQHNTMDVEYYGPNPQMTGWYLGALRAVEEMARYLGEAGFAAQCRALFESGSRWMDDHLFNGEYYEHAIRPPDDEAAVAPGLRATMGAQNLHDPDLQLGAGCLVDQLVGQTMAHVCGLGYLHDPAHVRATLDSLMQYNFRQGFYGHFNHLRSFVLNDEAALLMATYPKGRRPKRPFPYYNEVMTGFEYTAAAHMLYEGQVENGLKVIEAIRARYDGLKRSPFDEAECGHHYARAMASWAAVLALTGFRYSGVEKTMQFAAAPGPAEFFWSTGDAWGVFRQTPGEGGVRVEVEVKGGTLQLRKITLTRVGSTTWDAPQTLGRGEKLTRVLK